MDIASIALHFLCAAVAGFLIMSVFGVQALVALCSSVSLARRRKHQVPAFDLALALRRIAWRTVIGFLGVANILSFFLEKYPDPSVCVFIGLITGMLPSLFREAGEQGRSKGSYISMAVCMCVIFTLLIGLQMTSIEVAPNFFWYLFCGFCLALSIIAPGMSFSTLLMPLGLYTPFIDGIGHFDMGILIPGGIGALVTVICLAKAVNALFDNYYSIAFHGIIGIVIAATVMIIPFSGFTSPGTALVNGVCIIIGILVALALDKFNSRVKVE